MESNSNKIIAILFEEIADMLEMLDENPFKISAFRNSARVIQSLPRPVEEMLKTDELKNVKGIGKASIEKIKEFVESGIILYHDELKKSIPSGLFEILKIKGLGPKKVKRLWKELDITNLGELEYACKENRLTLLTGFGEKTQQNVLEKIAFLRLNSGKFLSSIIFKVSEEFSHFLQKAGFEHFSPSGALRRKSETYNSIEFVIADDNEKKILAAFKKYFNVFEHISDNKYRALHETGIPFIITLCNEVDFVPVLFYESASVDFLSEFSKYAKTKNIGISVTGIKMSEKTLKVNNEEEIFKTIGINFIRPELRENPTTISIAEKNVLPDEIKVSDIKGALHIHTSWSDGAESIESMVESAISLGFEYIGFCDHSRAAFYANGLTPERLEKQWTEIDAIQKKYKNIKIFKGIESDILKDGSLDYPDSILKQFDFIVASIHSNFTLSYEEMTNRLVQAATNKYTTILGHPSGRLLLSRESYKFDWEKVITACKKNNTALELNSDEHRLDVSVKIIERVIKEGIKISINSDAHQSNSLKNIEYGVGMANKTLIQKKDILNAYSADDFVRIIKKA